MIYRLPQEGHRELKLMLWQNLGEVLRTRRRDFAGAIAAFEVADSLEPGNLDRRRILAELYLNAGEEFRAKAIRAHHDLLARDPSDIEAYRSLRGLYMDAGQYDRAWCLCAALSFLKRADREEAGFFRQYRRQKFGWSDARLRDEHWHKIVNHPEQSPRLSSILAVIAPVLAPATARPPSHYRLRPAEHRDAVDPRHPYPRIFDRVTAVLGVPQADLYLRPRAQERLVMAHTPEAPSFVAGEELLGAADGLEGAFITAKKLSYLRPDLFLRCALPSRAQIGTALIAAMKLLHPPLQVAAGQAKVVEQHVTRLHQHLQPLQLEQLQRLLSKLDPARVAVEVERWWNAIELTSDRAGLVICGDLEAAVRMIGAEASSSEVAAEERVRALVAFFTSEAYLRLRGELGVGNAPA
jgi:hypothetical protein